MIRFGKIRIDRKRKIIWNGTKHYAFLPCYRSDHRSYVKFELLMHLLLSGGISKSRLFALLYENDPEGGPLGHISHINTCLTYVKIQIKHLELTLHKEKIGGENHYWVT